MNHQGRSIKESVAFAAALFFALFLSSSIANTACSSPSGNGGAGKCMVTVF
jgi:hypothetical protein